jgi:hypothetical protein
MHWLPRAPGPGGGGWPGSELCVECTFSLTIVPISPFPFVFWKQPASGKQPALEWLQRLDKEDRRKMGMAMRTVELGWPLGMPLCRSMGGGLHELRAVSQWPPGQSHHPYAVGIARAGSSEPMTWCSFSFGMKR